MVRQNGKIGLDEDWEKSGIIPFESEIIIAYMIAIGPTIHHIIYGSYWPNQSSYHIW
jgi:hypothetical protein